MKLWYEWCQSVGITEVGQLKPYDMDEYYDIRASDVQPVTLEGEMWTLTHFTKFLESLNAVDDGLSDAIRIPDLDPEDRSNDTKLHTEDALALLQYYRSSETDFGKRKHAFLELAWFTGARQGGIRALDIRDVELGEEGYADFRHRPETGTPLKNKLSGERPVALTPETVDVLKHYKRNYRFKVRDDHGRQPFLTSMRGRASTGALRMWSYTATLPCVHGPCPHGKRSDDCEWVEYSHASKCPSSRSPHQIRTGAITWFLNRGWPPEDVAERVNATVRTIESHYDKADPEERRRRLRDRMEKRRRPLLNQLEIQS